MSNLVALPTLIFPTFAARIETVDGSLKIYDTIRKKYVALTPEEWVRQHCIHWLLSRGYPIGRCSIERTITGSGMRYDVLWVDATLAPFLLIECKAPDVNVNSATLRQSAWYNLTLRSPHVLLTNGKVAYCATVQSDGTAILAEDVPPYPPNILHL